MEKYIRCLLVGIFNVVLLQQIVFSQALTLTIETEKKVYSDGEPLFIYAKLENKTNKTLRYNMFYLESGNLTIKVNDSYGKNIPYSGMIYEYSTPDSIMLLAPNGSIYYMIDLKQYYWNKNESKYPLTVHQRFKPGGYTFSVTYMNGQSELVSNELFVKIIKPNDEESVNLDLLLKLMVPQILWNQDKLNTISKFTDLSKKLSSSIYLPLVQSTLAGLYITNKEFSTANVILKNIIDSNPYSGYAVQAFDRLSIDKNERQRVIEHLKMIDPLNRTAILCEQKMLLMKN